MLAVVLLLVACLSALGQGITVRVRPPLQPVLIHGKSMLAYELDVLNQSTTPVNLLRLEVNDEKGVALLAYDQSELSRNGVQVAPTRGKLGTLKPGARAIIFCWIAMPAAVGRVKHRLSYSGASQPAEADAAIEQPAGLMLGAPLEAGDWWIANGPSNASEHRRAQIRKDGDPGAPFGQRYAIDFGRICDGRFYLNKGKSNADYCGYGSKVLAVVDAQVLVARDGIVDNSPGSIAVKLSKDTLLGNYVVLSIGGGQVAVYAHLKPGTVLVKAGDTVHRGQEIARIGNSGNLDAPHLHYHVSQGGAVDDIALVQTNPVAYMFDNFQTVGTYSEKGLSSIPPESWTGDLPGDGSVIRLR
jgi:murein DD-endopeptidase